MYVDDGLYLTSKQSADYSFQLENEPPTTVEYRGCYRLNDGSYIRYLKFYPYQCNSAKDCHIDIKFLAPLYEENSKCTINWNTSSYLIDNKPWQYVRDPDSNVTIIPAEDFRGSVLRISYRSYQNWSGKVLKLQVKCSSRTTSEEQCVLVKFPSGSKPNIPTTDPWSNSSDKKSSRSNPYKISTIVLSVLICIILVSILAYVVHNILRKNLRRDRHRTSAELPFCAETDGEPEM